MTIIEEFRGGSGAMGGSGRSGGFAGAGGFGGSRSSGGSGGMSGRSTSQGGSRQYGSADYAKTNNFTGGSFGGVGKYGNGFPGIVPGAKLAQQSSPSVYYDPGLYKSRPVNTVPSDINLPKSVRAAINREKPIPGPRPGYGNKYDNVNPDNAIKIRGPGYNNGRKNNNWKYNRQYNRHNNNWRNANRDKNLTGYYGYQGAGYYLDPWYWGYGPYWPDNGVYMNYPDIPYNYEDAMNNEIDADNVYTIQEEIAKQMEQESIQEAEQTEQTEQEKQDNNQGNESIKQVMEKYQSITNDINNSCNLFGYDIKEILIIIILGLILVYIIMIRDKKTIY